MGQPKILQIEAQARSLINPWVPGPARRVKNPDRGGLMPSEFPGVGDSEVGGRTRFNSLRGPQGHQDREKPANPLSLGTREEKWGRRSQETEVTKKSRGSTEKF